MNGKLGSSFRVRSVVRTSIRHVVKHGTRRRVGPRRRHSTSPNSHQLEESADKSFLMLNMLAGKCSLSTHYCSLDSTPPWFTIAYACSMPSHAVFVCVFQQLRTAHTTTGSNWFIAARRYRCHNPGCRKVKEAVRVKMESLSDDYVMPRSQPSKREVTKAERECMERGELSEISPNVIGTLLNGGWPFSIYDER